MHSRICLLLLTLLALCPPGFAGTSKNGKAAISFHIEAQELDNPKMIFSANIHGENRFYSRSPEFSLKDMTSYRSFPVGEEDPSFGVIIYLKPHAAQRLIHITNANRRKWLAAQVNGRAVDEVFIDDDVTDGKLIIWNNLTAADLETIGKALPHADELKKKEEEKAKKKKD